jgi:hypothetical protein
MELIVTRLTIDDIGDNLALAREVGWPDTESDWSVIHRGAIVVGVRAEGSLVGQGALGVYGQAGTNRAECQPCAGRGSST